MEACAPVTFRAAAGRRLIHPRLQVPDGNRQQPDGVVATRAINLPIFVILKPGMVANDAVGVINLVSHQNTPTRLTPTRSRIASSLALRVIERCAQRPGASGRSGFR